MDKTDPTNASAEKEVCSVVGPRDNECPHLIPFQNAVSKYLGKFSCC